MVRRKDAVLEVLPIDEVKPYWRNPRVITDEAVKQVSESIKRFGYQQPIVVDKKHVIVAGHTRYAALRQLGYTEVQVIVSDLPAKKAQEYRVVDNKVAEYSSWDDDALVQELREFNEELLADFFPDVDLGLDFKDVDLVTDKDNQVAEGKVTGQLGSVPVPGVVVTCTSCFADIEMPEDSIMNLAEELRARRGGEQA